MGDNKDNSVDITDQVETFGLNDDECLSLTRCVCGEQFEPWDFILSIYEDSPKECPSCGRQMYFSARIRVYEVQKETEHGNQSQ